jgi:hypothetical protein
MPTTTLAGSGENSAEDLRMKYNPFSFRFPDWRFASTPPPVTPEDRKFFKELESSADKWREKYSREIELLIQSSRSSEIEPTSWNHESVVVADALAATLVSSSKKPK